MEIVVKTKKGLFIRQNEDSSLTIFSPYSGLFFAVAKQYASSVLDYYNGKEVVLPEIIIRNLNIGISEYRGKFDIVHWLPQKEFFDRRLIEKPIVVNWLISNKCNFNCSYCYAGDVIDKDFEDSNIVEIANRILALNPLAIVFSGGEPLLEKEKIMKALKVLGDKVGIILDTNGYIYDDELVAALKKCNAVIRISLDSLHNELNSKIRPMKDSCANKTALETIIKNLFKYEENNLTVLIHTVVTPINKNSLDDLYEKLPLLGVNGWRIFSVLNPNNEERRESFKKIIIKGHSKHTKNKELTNKDIEEVQQDIQYKISIFKKKKSSKCNFSFEVVASNESSKNSVILVLPDGKFATENIFKHEKVVINVEAIFKDVDLRMHYERYLGKI